MMKKSFLLLLSVSSLMYGAERYEQLRDKQQDTGSHSESSQDTDDLVNDELGGLEKGVRLETNLESELLRKALRHNVFRTPDQREKLDKMVKDNPPAFGLLAQLFHKQLPTRGLGAAESFAKTPASVRTAASIRLDLASQAAIKDALKQYQLEKNYEQLKAWLDTAHVDNDNLRQKLAEALAEKKEYKRKLRRLRKEMALLNESKED